MAAEICNAQLSVPAVVEARLQPQVWVEAAVVSGSLAWTRSEAELAGSVRIPRQEEEEATAGEFVPAAAGVAVASAVDFELEAPWRTLLAGSKASQ